MAVVTNMKIGNKLAAGFAIIIVLLVGILAISIWGIFAVKKAVNSSYSEARKMETILEARNLVHGFSLDLANIILQKDQSKKDAYSKMILSEREDYGKKMNGLRAIANSKEEQNALDKIDRSAATIVRYNTNAVELGSAGMTEEASSIFTTYSASCNRALDSTIMFYTGYQKRIREQIDRSTANVVWITTVLLIVFGAASLAVALVLGIIITRSISGPLSISVQQINDVSKGNISCDVPEELLKRGDEIGLLARALQNMCVNWRKIIGEVSKNTATIFSTSGNLSTSSTQIASDAQEMTAQSSTVASTSEQMSANVSSISVAAEEMSANVAMITTAIEEMNISISEVSKNCIRESQIVESANEEAKATQKFVKSTRDFSQRDRENHRSH